MEHARNHPIARPVAIALIGAGLSLLPWTAPAQTQPAPRPFAVTADAATDCPVDIGVRLQGET